MMLIIPTCASKAIGSVIPELNGKMDSMALRVPVSNGSIADMVLPLKNNVTKDKINKVLKDSSNSKMKGMMAYTEDPIVSSDIIGESHSSVVDGLSTMVTGGKSNWLKSCHGMTMNGVLLAD